MLFSNHKGEAGDTRPDPENPSPDRLKTLRRSRRRDFTALLTLFAVILLILVFSRTLGLVEAVIAFFAVFSASLSYYLATSDGDARFAGTGPETPDRASQESTPASVAIGLIRNLPLPAFVVDGGRRIPFGNRKAGDVFNLPMETGGFNLAVLRRPELLDAIERTLNDGMPRDVELRIVGAQEQIFQASIRCPDPATRNLLVCCLLDLSAVKRAEKARADFLANASHELRTPLTSLAGFIETMRGPAREDYESWDRFLEIMFGQTERMRRLIHDLLSLSRIELSEHRRPEGEHDVNAIIHEIRDALAPVAKEKGVTLQLPEATGPMPVRGNRDELAQVAQNLMDNAIKYSDPNSTIKVQISSGLGLEDAQMQAARRWSDAHRISVVSSSEARDSRFTVVRVENEGRGIGREHLPRLAERFYRVDEGRDRLVGGTGLGLAIVKHIVMRHRGAFMVESQPGDRVAFSVILPEPQSMAEGDRLEAAE